MTYHFAPEIVRVAVVLGVVFSVLMYERVHLTTGGAIVPGYLAINLFSPLSVVTTLVGGVATYYLVSVLLAKRTILYGRRKFEVEVLVGLAVGTAFSLLAAAFSNIDPYLGTMAGIGYLLPGIVAHDIARQGIRKTLIAVTIVTVTLAAFLVGFNRILTISPKDDLSTSLEIGTVTGFPRELLLIAVAISVGYGMIVYSRLGARSGGFITGAYVALISPRLADLVFTLATAVITWFVVTHVLMPRLLIFGRRKLATMLLIAALTGWIIEVIAVLVTDGSYVPWRGMTIATLMVPALVANDAQRQGWKLTIVGTTVTAGLTALTMAGVTALFDVSGIL